MNSLILFVLILLVVANAAIQEGDINKFTMDEFNELMDKKALIVVFMRNVNCLTCEADRWTVAKLNYNFMLRRDFYVLEGDAGDIPEFDKEFSILDDFANPQFLLFKDGDRTPRLHNNAEDIAEWITKETLIEHFPDEVIELNEDTYKTYPKKNPKRNVLVMFYVPKFEHTQLIVANYFRHAFAFRNEYSIVFARFNCEEKMNFCKSLDIESVLEFRFIPAQGTDYDGEVLKSLRGERIADFVNRHIGTEISGMGGMNERFGRVKELDILAHHFMETKDEEKRSQIIKDTAKLRKRYKSTGKYYKFMKMIQKEGIDAFKEEKKTIKDELQKLNMIEGHDYEVLRAKQNIAEVFQNIKTQHRVVNLTPYSFDYVIDGDHNVMLMINTKSCQTCNIMNVIYTNAAKKGLRGVVFAYLDGDKYVDFAANYYTEPDKPILWFQRGTPVSAPIFADVKTDVDSIFRFAQDHMTEVSDDEIRNEDEGEGEEDEL